jgi:hypothetical protein
MRIILISILSKDPTVTPIATLSRATRVPGSPYLDQLNTLQRQPPLDLQAAIV